MIRDKPMDKPMTKSMISESSSRSSSCEANEEAMKVLRMENLACEVEKISCMKNLVQATELLQKPTEIISLLAHALEELITGM